MYQGEDLIAGAIDGAAPPVDEEQRRKTCPVVPLGAEAGIYHFITPSGEWRHLQAREFNTNGLASLFEGKTTWLVHHFPRRNKEGAVVGFAAAPATQWLMSECHDRGMLPADLVDRGVGVWRVEGKHGPEAVVHVGDGVWRNGTWHRPGLRIGRVLFAAKGAVSRPAFDKKLPVGIGERLQAHLRLWQYKEAIDAELLLGYIGVAAIGAHPPLRTHVLLSAVHGAGKSTLLKLIAAALGDQAVEYNDFSEAGLRQILADQARGLLLDEAEGTTGGGHRMTAVVELIRGMSTGSGAKIVRGSIGGSARGSAVAAAVLMAAINPPPLAPQDRSRFHRVEMRKATSDPLAARKVEEAINWAAKASAQLRARAVLKVGLFHQANELYRQGLIERGCDGRQADKFAALLAGRDILIHDDPPDSDSIDVAVTDIAPLLDDVRAADADDSDAERCLNHLLGSAPDIYRSGVRMTVGEMISYLRQRQDESVERALGICGLRLEKAKDEAPERLLVATNHPGMGRIFRDTNWKDGGWITSLSRLGDDVVRSLKARFAGAQSRAIGLPGSYLPPPSADVLPGGSPDGASMP